MYFFTRSVGEGLGLKVEDGNPTTVGTATGTFRVYLHAVTMSVLDFEFDAYVYFAEDENFSRMFLGELVFLTV